MDDQYGLEDDLLEDDGDLDDGLDHLHIDDDLKDDLYDNNDDQYIEDTNIKKGKNDTNTDKNNKNNTDKNNQNHELDKNEQKDMSKTDKKEETVKDNNKDGKKKKGLGSLFG